MKCTLFFVWNHPSMLPLSVCVYAHAYRPSSVMKLASWLCLLFLSLWLLLGNFLSRALFFLHALCHGTVYGYTVVWASFWEIPKLSLALRWARRSICFWPQMLRLLGCIWKAWATFFPFQALYKNSDICKTSLKNKLGWRWWRAPAITVLGK